MKMSLRDWDIDDSHFEKITERLVKMGIGEFKLKENDILQILEKSV